MTKIPDNALMLICVMPNRKDYEYARVLGWYRIPLRMAPKIVDVDYLAFYQPNSFGNEHRWQIETYAEVKGHELTTRKELIRDEPDHPHAREEYYKIQLGPLQKRAKPIRTDKWKRLTFLYTTGDLFNEAEIINDLVVKSEDREFLWKSLRERQNNHSSYDVAQKDEIFLSDPSISDFLQLMQLMDSDEDYNSKF